MATTEQIDQELLKEAIVQRLAGIDDPKVLDALFTLADRCGHPKPLTPEEKVLLEQGRKEYAGGHWITNEQLKEKVAEWRSKKK